MTSSLFTHGADFRLVLRMQQLPGALHVFLHFGDAGTFKECPALEVSLFFRGGIMQELSLCLHAAHGSERELPFLRRASKGAVDEGVLFGYAVLLEEVLVGELLTTPPQLFIEGEVFGVRLVRTWRLRKGTWRHQPVARGSRCNRSGFFELDARLRNAHLGLVERQLGL